VKKIKSYNENKKNISRVKHLEMDDGESHKSGFILNTSGFTLSDIKLLTAQSRPPATPPS
jgi:hypothetical protein